MKMQVTKYQKLIQWKENATCVDIDQMVRAAKMNLDAGKEKTMELMPEYGFHDWVKYVYIHTCLYNRDRPAGAKKMLCIIRMVLYQCIDST